MKENDARILINEYIKSELGLWEVHFIAAKDGVRYIAEEKPIVCRELNLYINSPCEFSPPEVTLPNGEIIGIFGDDEFSWIWRKQDGSIREIDPYDLNKGCIESGAAFPCLSHYLLFVVDYSS